MPVCSPPDFAYEREPIATASPSATSLSASAIAAQEPVGSHKFGAMFELHIEQGPILEDEQKMIGVVTGVQGMRWYEVTVNGQEAHTGATPMHLRKNALLGAARMIEAIDQIGLDHLPGVATVGLIENRPNSRNVVPGEVFFTVDLRHPDETVLDVMEARLSGGAAGDRRAARARDRGEAHLELAGGQVRARSDRLRAPWRRAGRLCRRATWSRAPATTPPISPASRRRR